MGFVEAIKEFFVGIYTTITSGLYSFFDAIGTFFTNAYDLGLIILILVLAVFVFKFLKYLTVPAIILSQITMLTFTITAMMSFIVLIATSLAGIYNRIFVLATYITNEGSSVSCLGSMLNCLGINGILSVFFTEIFALFIVVLLIRTTGVFLWAFGLISDRVWKLGVLLGLI